MIATRRPAMEMQQKNPLRLHDTLFGRPAERPVSVATEFMESDVEEDEIRSEYSGHALLKYEHYAARDDDSQYDSQYDGYDGLDGLDFADYSEFNAYQEYRQQAPQRPSRHDGHDGHDGHAGADNSPRASLRSGQPSFTTVSTLDEAPTPRSSMPDAFALPTAKAVEGPRGPHLFRISTLSTDLDEHALSLSPLGLSPSFPSYPSFPSFPSFPPTLSTHKEPPTRFARTTNRQRLAAWTPEQVAQWMLDAGVELSVCERFVENDITGAILQTLKFEDLKELGIPSFGVRTTVWAQIAALKETPEPMTRPATLIEDAPDRHVRRELRRQNSVQVPGPVPVPDQVPTPKSTLRRGPSVRRLASRANDDITPLESVSIVGIEQMMPRPHVCRKGVQCSKWRRQQRLLDAWKRENKGGVIMIAGDPGNPATARSLDIGGLDDEHSEDDDEDLDEHERPVSEAVPSVVAAPSVVASSDVMGPGAFAPQPVGLEAERLRAVQSRDPQDNVRQFLSFQHAHAGASEVPPTPPFELYPQGQTNGQNLRQLRALPKLAIPNTVASKRHSHSGTPNQNQGAHGHHHAAPASAHPLSSKTASAAPTSGTSYTHTAMEESPGRTPLARTGFSGVSGVSPGYSSPHAPYRFGTPCTDIDVPVTAVPSGPVARDTSQSVPPDMGYRAGPVLQVQPIQTSPSSQHLPQPQHQHQHQPQHQPQRTMSRASARRPSFPVLPSLFENRVAPNRPPVALSLGHQRAASAMGHRFGTSPQQAAQSSAQSAQSAQSKAPPRHVYPWSPAQKSFEKAIAPLSLVARAAPSSSVSGSVSGSVSSTSLASGTVSVSGSASASVSVSGSATGPVSVSGSATPASSTSSASSSSASASALTGISYQGDVKKRKTKMLRHEWHDRFVTLKGTRLAVHKDRASRDKTIEYVDIDDYAIACSTMAASTSKLNAAFKAINIRRDRDAANAKDDVAAFAFQLIPQDARGGVRLRKRDSALPAALGTAALASSASLGAPCASGSGSAADSAAPATSDPSRAPTPPPDAANGTGKTHHFAVKSRDDRIEWMRELMLAKAMRQKGAGFEVSVNGNMI